MTKNQDTQPDDIARRTRRGVRSTARGIVAAALVSTLPACSGDVQDLEEPTGTIQQALSSTDIKVMSFNLKIKPSSNRLERIFRTIRHHSPDIVGLQEIKNDTWPLIKAEFPEYDKYFQERGGNEGLAILSKGSRFDLTDHNYKNFKGSDRRKANDCKTPLVQKRGDRIAMRVKLVDRVTDETIDVFNTHFPSSDGSDIVDCEKVGMAKLVREYVRKFGDNAILMGDFNTGVSQSGTWSEGLEKLTKRQESTSPAYLTETYIETHDMGDGHPFDTANGGDPMGRYGTKIDHIMVAPAFDIKSAEIDYSLFDGLTRLDCRKTVRRAGVDECNGIDVDDLHLPSDHWAILSVVNRTACARSDCAASR